MKTRTITRNLALAATVFAMAVLVLGAFTRLVDAGLGCPDWPGCYGHILWPDEQHEITAANAAFPDTPVDTDKTWPEMLHRYLAAGLGLLAIALVVLCWRDPRPGAPTGLAAGLLGLIMLQGLFGMWTVTLKLWPQVVSLHLLGGFASFNLLWLLSLRLGGWQLAPPLPAAARARLCNVAWLVLAVVTGQIFLGGWTTANYAAVACPDFPTCQFQWWPPMDFAAGFNFTQRIGPNYLGGLLDNNARVAIHITHRLGALLVVVAVALLCGCLYRYRMKRLAALVAGITALQLLLGIGNVVLHFPIAVAVAHNLVGALLAASVVLVLFGLYTAPKA